MSAPEPGNSRLQIECRVEGGMGKVSYVMSRAMLQGILDGLGASGVNDIPDQFLRSLCNMANYGTLQAEMERKVPGSTRVVIPDAQGKPEIELHPAELGYDMAMRIAETLDDQDGLLLDPQYSPVTFEIRTCNDEPEVIVGIGQCVFSTVLEPPSLA